MSKHLNRIRCKICGSGRYFLVYRKPKSKTPKPSKQNAVYRISEECLEHPEKIVRCASCGFCFAVQPAQTIESIARDYQDMVDEEYMREEMGRREQARVVLSRLRKHKTSGQLLEIGCGPGFFLDEARRLGFGTQGVEPSRWAAALAKDRFGLQIHNGSFEHAKLADVSCDVIVLLDVIEHVEDPKLFLEEVWRVLKNDGVLYISTPDIKSWLSRLLGAKWWGINKYHLSYFSKKTLEELLKRTGLKSVRYHAYPRIFSFSYWSLRLASYPFWIRAPFAFLARIGPLGRMNLKIVLHDQIDVVAQKRRSLDTVQPRAELTRSETKARQKVIAVLPAYNAAKTLARTVRDIPMDTVDEVILVDDVSQDNTVEIAEELGLTVIQHKVNRGYGGNQKTCYAEALKRGADIVVMVHPDYQYDPTVIPNLIKPIRQGHADAVFGSRIMAGAALDGGMPRWKYNANILLTAFENLFLNIFLTEYHSGFRAYSAPLLRSVKLEENSDNFIFDTEIIVQIAAQQFRVREIPIQTRYFDEASSISFWPSVRYGLGILRVITCFFLHSRGIFRSSRYAAKASKPLKRKAILSKPKQ